MFPSACIRHCVVGARNHTGITGFWVLVQGISQGTGSPEEREAAALCWWGKGRPSRSLKRIIRRSGYSVFTKSCEPDFESE